MKNDQQLNQRFLQLLNLVDKEVLHLQQVETLLILKMKIIR